MFVNSKWPSFAWFIKDKYVFPSVGNNKPEKCLFVNKPIIKGKVNMIIKIKNMPLLFNLLPPRPSNVHKIVPYKRY